MNHPLLPYVRQSYSRLNEMISYGFIWGAAWASLQKENIVTKSNPVKVTEGIIKNFRPLFKWFVDKEIQSQDWVDKIIHHWAARTQDPDQLGLILKVVRAREYSLVFRDGWTAYYKMDIPYNLRWEAFKKLSEFIIKNWSVGDNTTEFWREHNVKYDLFVHNLKKLTQAFETLERAYLRTAEEQLHHYSDLMETQEDFKALKKVKWVEPISTLLEILKEKHDEINASVSKRGIRATPKPHEEFIKVNEKLRWVLVNDRFCPYEKEGMGHCATAPQGCFLVSLREYSNKANFGSDFAQPIWVPRVTATVCPTGDGQYYVTEILGPENNAPMKKWEGAIYKLYLHPKIHSYSERSSTSHSPSKLPAKKREKVYEQKAAMAPPSKRLKTLPDNALHLELLEYIRQYSRAAYGLVDSVISYKGDGHILIYENESAKSFFNLIDFFTDRQSRDEFNAIVEAYDEPYIWSDHNDYYPSWRDIDPDNYLSELDEKTLKKVFGTPDFRQIEKYDIPEDIQEMMQQAESDGQRAGTESALSDYAFQVLKEVKFEDDDGNDTAFVDFNNGKWQFWIQAKDLRKAMIAAINADYDVIDYVFKHVDFQRRDRWNYEIDYDSEVSIERFKELFSEKYGE